MASVWCGIRSLRLVRGAGACVRRAGVCHRAPSTGTRRRGPKHLFSLSKRGFATGGKLQGRFDGKTALVTGGGKGIGRAIVNALCEQGATKVYAVSRTLSDLDEICNNYPNARGLQVDLADVEGVTKTLSGIDAPHMVVNNAGIASLESFLDTKASSFDNVMNVNVKAAMITSQICAKKMIEGGISGSIVNVSSMASMVGLKDHTSYCVSKGGIDQLTRVMALELGQHGIRTNCVNPTIVFTAMGRMAWSDPVKNKPMMDRIPLGKFCEEADVVNPILFLLSDEAAMVNGAMIPLEGGFLASPFNMKEY